MKVEQQLLFQNTLETVDRFEGAVPPPLSDPQAGQSAPPCDPSGLLPDEGRLSSREYPLSNPHLAALEGVFEEYRLRLNGFDLEASYYRYQGLTHTIRVRGSRLLVRISHHFESEPDRVIEAVARILIRKLLRMRPLKREIAVCRDAEERLRAAVAETPVRAPRSAGPNRFCSAPSGQVHDLRVLAENLSNRFFQGRFSALEVFWSARRAKGYWGKYYPEPPRIVINSRLDHPDVPDYVVEAVLYHEMLHHHLGVQRVNGRRRIHTPEFRRWERKFPHHAEAEKFLEEFSRRARKGKGRFLGLR